jgi:ubiquinone/menaquinone biosynthesis C-methylase UbiE
VNNFRLKSPGIIDVISHENEHWSKVFEEASKQNRSDKKFFSSFWWEDYYIRIVNFVSTELQINNDWKILEAGSGSGKSSILLGKSIKRVFLDISEKALDYAKLLVQKFDVENIDYVQADIFQMPFDDQSFDLVWNIGVIEHYNKNEIVSIFREMIRVTERSKYIGVGVPNFWTGATLKAWLLKQPILKFIKGYRLDSEKFYSQKDLISMMYEATKLESREIKIIKVKYFGNPLPIETPKFLLNTVGELFAKIIPKSKFLTFILIKLD